MISSGYLPELFDLSLNNLGMISLGRRRYFSMESKEN